MENPETFVFEIEESAAGLRLDQALARSLGAASDRLGLPRLSRTRLRRLLEEGAIEAIADPGRALDPTRIARAGERFRVELAATDAALKPESIPLDILFEDSHLLVVNKIPGMLVHPAHKGHTGTLAHAVLAHCGAGLAGVGHPLRPGIVHRLDVGTGGLLVVAKTETARLHLAERFAAHDIEREYLAIAWGAPARANTRLANRRGVAFCEDGWIRVNAPVGPHPRHPAKRGVVQRGGKRAVTRVRPETFTGPGAPPAASLLRCRLETGRTHQIRVHLAWIGHPLVGDKAYGRAPTLSPSTYREQLRHVLATFPRPALHAVRLGFPHPATGAAMRFQAAPHSDFQRLAEALGTPVPDTATGIAHAAML